MSVEAVEITVTVDAEGRVRPLRFKWRGRAYRVESVGRSWEDTAGLHVLVMTASGRMFELLGAAAGRWYLAGAAPDPQVYS
jgi:hypothetical protein